MIYDEHDQIGACRRDYPGWSVILEDLQDRLLALNVDVYVTQIKEKFGTLRFYFGLAADVSDDVRQTVHEIVGTAEAHTSIVCCLCAAPRTKQGSGHWILYFCDKHDKEDLTEYWKENPDI